MQSGISFESKIIPTQILGSVWSRGFITLTNIKLPGLKVIFVWAVLYASLCYYNRQWTSFDCVVLLMRLHVCSWNCNHCVTTATRLIESLLTDKWTKFCNNRYELQKWSSLTVQSDYYIAFWLVFPTGAFCIPVYMPYILTGKWMLGKGLCKLWLVVDYLLCTASVFNIVLISYDRYLSVTKAVSPNFMPNIFIMKQTIVMYSLWFSILSSWQPAESIVQAGDKQQQHALLMKLINKNTCTVTVTQFVLFALISLTHWKQNLDADYYGISRII